MWTRGGIGKGGGGSFETRLYFIAIAVQSSCRVCNAELKENHDGWKLNGTHQLLVCADNVKYWAQGYVQQRKTRKLW
jgi:hypothetical protein